MNPECPNCGGPMAQKTGRRGAFWGCLRFPDCNGTREVGAAVPGNVKEPDAANASVSFAAACLEEFRAWRHELQGELRGLRVAVDRLTDAVNAEGMANDINLMRHAAMTIADEMRITNRLAMQDVKEKEPTE